MQIGPEIRKLANDWRMDTARLLGRMVQIPSLSCEEEAVVREIAGMCEDAGFDEVRIDGLGNVLARIGNGPRMLAIDAHIDTVDTGDRSLWDFDPFSGAIESDHVLGRGTVDQEGGAASMITAGRILKHLDYSGQFTVWFTFTVQEEDCDGMCWNYLIEQEKLIPELAVSTEPTNLNLYRGHRGRMEFELYFPGLSCHGSAPERGDNALYKAARAALEVEALHERLASDVFLGKGSITATLIQSTSPSLCAVPDQCRVHLDRRLTWGETKESALAEIRGIVPDETRVEIPVYDRPSWKGTVFRNESYFPTWKLEPDHPLVLAGVETHLQLFGAGPHVDKWTFSTNAVAICGKHNIPTIGFGPGNEVLAHAPNERTPIDHLEAASAFYAMLPHVLETQEAS